MLNSGETSMGFMLIVALIMRIVGAAFTPVAIKLLGLVSLYLTAFAIWLIAKEVGVRSPWRESLAILLLWFPGNAFAANYGMENTFFAALSCFFVWAVILAGWYKEEGSCSIPIDIALGVFAGALFWLRPETVPLIAILLLARFAGAVKFKRIWSSGIRGSVVFSVAFAILIYAYVAIYRHYSGEMPYGAGQIRRIWSLQDSIRVLGVPINLKILARIAGYFTVTVPAFFIGLIALTRRHFDWGIRLKILTIWAIFFGFFSAYLFDLLPTLQFSRYSAFVWPYGFLLSALCLQTIVDNGWFSKPVNVICILTILLCFFGAVAFETYKRINLDKGTGQAALQNVQWYKIVPERREALSATMAKTLGIPAGTPATLAYQEVQVRYELTDNFTIIPLDGLTDSRFFHYFCGKWVDHDGYLIDTKVDYVMEFPDYNIDKTRWSLEDLLKLQVGQSLVRPGIIYTRIQPDAVRVQRTVAAASNRPGGVCEKGN
jgi:hypothetical protein